MVKKTEAEGIKAGKFGSYEAGKLLKDVIPF
jgi:hypothetical protein